jgi:4-hydroxythreonine-4-phosphate dehydrogenase
VAGLNPHGGEGGLLGDEEAQVIAPAVRAAAAEGIDVSGPYPTDHIFRLARAGRFDVVIAMYHDQARRSPPSCWALNAGSQSGSATRSSSRRPSHGTAFDIAGQGVADPGPMRQALDVAERLAAQVSSP